MQWIIDRFEGDFAVCECADRTQMQDIPRHLIPPDAREGTVLTEIDGQYVIDLEATAARTERISHLMDSLWE